MRKPYSRTYARHQHHKKAIRHKKITEHYWSVTPERPYFPYLGMYDSHKIYCSCGMCTRYRRTNNKGRRRKIHANYAPSYNPSIRDQKMIEKLNASYEWYLEESDGMGS